MATVTFTGRWVAPDLTARSGRIIATRDDPTRHSGAAIVGSAVGVLDGTGALPSSGPGALRVTAPPTGQAEYVVRERLDEVTEHSYRITVLSSDTTIDLSTRPS